ncbi:O-succinylbenzoic acid--CoA ligase [Kytococcus aerolatus]|uniref:O-succinylbenzoic acid--CoA ligase n=1 Tax=Kytococcus aerolatus TaxID=592308 RepID=A0A212TCP8_9MICO|nr:AMP-binding protein [Kytococcus aerolatus]SNC63847.1 O-succinylbenzoic acid--CoA ligase [Kytococcus aerolatus]
MSPPAPVTIPPDTTADAVRAALAPVLAGERELALGTSGSTGSPARALLRGADLRASATATHELLGGTGRWVLALPPGHIAGVQVLVRATVAGVEPLITTGAEGSFDPTRLAADLTTAREADPTTRTYLSLVPTQVARLTEDPATACAVTAATDAVLVGGAALPAAVAERAATAGLPVVRTYGSTETCGGCVYDGLPLPGVEIGRTEAGRVTLTAPWVTRGWLIDDELVTSRAHAGGQGARLEDAPPAPDGTPRRTLVTDDLGEIGPDGRLRITGRADDLITTGGVKVAPGPVADAVGCLPQVAECAVVGAPDETWGQRVTVVAVPRGERLPLATLRDALREALPASALPRAVRWVEAMPLTGPGKHDRGALRRLATEPDEVA